MDTNPVKTNMFKCDVCVQTFRLRNSLTQHIRRKHFDVKKIVAEQQQQGVKCRLCGKSITKHNLGRHLSKLHGEKPIPKLKSGYKGPSQTCWVCNAMFSKRDLSSHLRTHGVQPSKRKALSCSPGCSFVCSRRSILRDHLSKVHDVVIIEKELKFTSYKEFIAWKVEEERRECNSFVAYSAPKKKNDTISYLICKRSGTPRTINERKRAAKLQGSCKTGYPCPASMTVIQKDNGTVVVKYYQTHYNHQDELVHVGLTKQQRKIIAGKLEEGVSFDTILNDVRDNVDSELSGIHRLTRKHLHNIVRNSGLAFAKSQHKEDAVSVRLWVKSMEQLGDQSPVLLYKERGKNVETQLPLSADDFMLVIMTPTQKEVYKMFAKQRVCVDSTHCTNTHKFILTTILLVDEFGMCIPAAFCLSNKVNTSSLTLFFKSVANAVGQSKCQIFMSDDAPSYVNAWSVVNGEPERTLLCAWCVDKNWKQNLKRVRVDNAIVGKEKRADIYQRCRTLLEETDQSIFESELSLTVLHFKSNLDTREFGEYFANNYGNRARQWAYCYDQKAGINTNIRLDALHRILENISFRGAVVKRVDRCVNLLLKLTRDKLFERLLMLDDEKHVYTIKTVKDRHQEALLINSDHITFNGDNEWTVNSRQIEDLEYSVTKRGDVCSGCKLQCRECKVCLHMFECNCVDSLIYGILCKHIHAVVLTSGICDTQISELSGIHSVESAAHFNLKETPSPESTIRKYKNKEKLQHLLGVLSSGNVSDETHIALGSGLDKLIDIVHCEVKRTAEIFQMLPEEEGEEKPLDKVTTQQNSCHNTEMHSLNASEVLDKMSLRKTELESTITNPPEEMIYVHNMFDHTYYISTTNPLPLNIPVSACQIGSDINPAEKI